MLYCSALRGAVAVALALSLSESIEHYMHDTELAEMIVGSTFVIVLLTVLALGCSTTATLKALAITTGSPPEDDEFIHLRSWVVSKVKLEVKAEVAAREGTKLKTFNRLKLA